MQIILNDIAVPFSNAELEVCMRSPLFNEADGSYIFNFTLPASEELKLALGYKHRINATRPQEVSFKLQRGSIVTIGTALVSTASEEEYEVAVGIGKGDFNYLLKDKKLNDFDIDYGDNIDIIAAAEATGMAGLSHTYSSEVYGLLFNNQITAPASGLFQHIYVDHHTQYKFNGTNSCIFNIKLKLETSAYSLMELVMYKNGLMEDSRSYINTNILEHNFTFFNVAGVANDLIWFQLESPNYGGEVINFGECTLLVYETDSILLTPTDDVYPVKKWAMFPVFNKMIAESLPNETLKAVYSDFVPLQNGYQGGKFPMLYTYNNGFSTQHATNLITPFLYIGFIIECITKLAGYTIVNNIFHTTEWKRLTLYNTAVQVYPTNDKNSIFLKHKCDCRELVNDMEVLKFLSNIGIITGHKIFINNVKRELEFTAVNDIVTKPETNDFNSNASDYQMDFQQLFNGYRLAYETSNDNAIKTFVEPLQELSNYVGTNDSPADPNLVPNKTDYYADVNHHYLMAWAYNTTSHAFELSKLLIDFRLASEVSGDSKLEILSGICPLMMSRVNPYTKVAMDQLLPISEQKGIFKEMLTDETEGFSYNVVLYHGLQPDGLNVDYPFASNDIYDTQGNVVGNLSLRMDGSYGVHSRWKAFIDFMLRCKKVFLHKQITELELKELLFSNKYRCFDRNLLLNEVKLKISDAAIETEEITAFTD
ncbi:MAG: hypothetical protein NTZ33_14550 [Bacteroidetes bacterium]|nr:hypothetical protein [Bacteroidota bacterium]